MKDEIKSSIFYAIILISFILTLSIAITTRFPMAEDITFHLRIAKDYYQGKSFSEVLRDTRIPYPPLFHYMLLIGIWLRIPLLFPLIIQVFLYPLALLSVGLLVKKHLSWGHAILAVLLLIGSWGFMDRTIQVQPQALDMILFPLSVHFFLEKKKLPFVLNNAVMFYCHSYYALMLFGSFCLYFLFKRKNLDMLILSGLTFIPVILMTYPVFFDKLDYAMTASEPQEEAVLKPLFFLFYMGAMSVFMIPSLFARYKDGFMLLVLCWAIVLSVLIPILPGRWINYAASPMSILCSVFILKVKNGRLRYMMISLVALLAILYMGAYFQQTILGGWHIDYEDLYSIRDTLYGRS